MGDGYGHRPGRAVNGEVAGGRSEAERGQDGGVPGLQGCPPRPLGVVSVGTGSGRGVEGGRLVRAGVFPQLLGGLPLGGLCAGIGQGVELLRLAADREAYVEVAAAQVAQALPRGGAAVALVGGPLLQAARPELLGQDRVQVEGREVLALVDQRVELHAWRSCRMTVRVGRRSRAAPCAVVRVMSSVPGRPGPAPSDRHRRYGDGSRPLSGSPRPARGRCGRR